jgi:hypothetical protein
MKDANNVGSIEECLRCKHKWISRVKYPKRCPNCTSPYWTRQKVIINKNVQTSKVEVNPILEMQPRIFPELKNRLMIAMRDRHPEIKLRVKDGVITEIL